jgi:5-methylcytosine-specific restriction endonuclease McrA
MWRALTLKHTRLIRARRAGVKIYEISDRDLERLMNRQGGRCAYCHTVPTEWQLDHIIPLIRGGQDAIGNLAWSCAYCNRSKRRSTVTEWYLRLRRKLAA